MFPKDNFINTLVLDAHISIRHLNVWDYASKSVWEAAQTWEVSRLLDDERKIGVREWFEKRSTFKRKLGEKTKKNKRRLESSGLAQAEAK